MPDQTHVSSYGQLRLSFMSDKWIMKILKDNEGVDTYKDLQKINQQRQEKFIDRRI
jgi:CMP-2-keto-3-deoxyoctulosonic acid synthetase